MAEESAWGVGIIVRWILILSVIFLTLFAIYNYLLKPIFSYFGSTEELPQLENFKTKIKLNEESSVEIKGYSFFLDKLSKEGARLLIMREIEKDVWKPFDCSEGKDAALLINKNGSVKYGGSDKEECERFRFSNIKFYTDSKPPRIEAELEIVRKNG